LWIPDNVVETLHGEEIMGNDPRSMEEIWAMGGANRDKWKTR
jgi:hypothetical protein